nr:zinc finger, CCHC-type, retrotransposon Gag domain protein [Tanacetum cinerariifolium]
MVNTRIDTDLSAAVQNALQTLLPQIREEIHEEFRTGSGSSNAGGNPAPVTVHTWLERFNKQKPHSFEKATAPLDAENWISHMEKIFDVMGCEDEFKTRLAVYKFEGSSGLQRFFRCAMFIYSFFLCYSLSLYPFTERYAQPYFFSCLIRQNALQTLLPQIRAEIREEFRTGSGQSDSGGNPSPVTIHTWLECFNKQKPRSFEKVTATVDAENWISHMEKIFDVMGCEDAFKTRLVVYKFEGNALAWWKAYKQAKGGDAWLITVANATRNYEILHERDDDDTERPDKRQKSGNRHQPTSQQSSHRNHGHNNNRHGSDRGGGSDNHRSSNNNYSGNNNRSSGNRRDQRNRGQQSNRSVNSGYGYQQKDIIKAKTGQNRARIGKA